MQCQASTSTQVNGQVRVLDHGKTRHLFALLSACGLLALTSVAQAQQASTVQTYGVLDISVGSFKDAGGRRSTQVSPGNMSTSFIGFKGEDDLGGGLKALFALETYVRNDTGATGRYDGDNFWSRNAYVALQGGWGAVKLGRSGTPLFFNTMRHNPFGASFGFSPAIRSFFSYTGKVAGDTAWDNAVAYNSPAFAGGWNADLLYAAKETGHGPNASAALRYADGAFSAGFVAQRVEVPFTRGDETTWQLGATYDFGVLKLMGQHGRVKEEGTNKATANTKDAITQIGVSLPWGPSGAFLASWAQAKTSGAVDAKRTFVTLGYDHKLSRRTDVYGIVMSDRWTKRESGSTVAVGIRHAF